MSDAAPGTTTTGATTTTTATTTTVPPRLTHLDEAGRARMVDVSGKDVTVRTASASGRVLLSPQAVAALRDGTVPKGDALAVARIAGIQGAKRTPDLIPLCHPLGLHGVTVDLTVADDGVDITATVKTADRTGVEMEALTSVSVAALTLIDMIKAVDKAAVVTDVRIDAKEGGKSGPWRRPADGRLSREPVGGRLSRDPADGRLSREPAGERQADRSPAGDRAEGEPS